MQQKTSPLQLLMLAALLSLAALACSRKTEPSPSPASVSSSAGQTESGMSAAASAAGGPQIATEADGVHIEYHVYGHGDPAVVLIHGWATDANYWNAQLAPLEARYTVVAVDLAGHGASSKNRSDWSMARYGEDVATVVRQIANPQVVLVGHSMGGTVALEAAGLLGPRVIGIVAVDALKSIGLPPLDAREIETRVAPFRADFIGTTRSFVTDSLFARGADPLFVQKVAYDMSLEPPEVAVPSLQALLSMDFSAVLPKVHVPVMAINSDLTPTDETRIRRFLPGFTAQILPGTGHFLMMEQPARFNPLLLRDIETLVQRAAH